MSTVGHGQDRLAREPEARAPHDRMRAVARRTAPPPLRPNLVDRPALVDGLLAGAHAPLVLVSAPAGYGKTTLLAQWHERDDRPFAWLSLEPADNNPVALVGAVITALTSVLALDTSLAGELAVPDLDLDERVLPALVDACAFTDRRCVLVLDDLHLVTEPRCHAALDHLALHLPPTCQLAFATRADPAVHLATLRAHGRLHEVRAADLALVEDEAAAVLATAGVTLTQDRLSQLVARTEGWPAGIYLAALSMHGSTDPDAYVERFAGTSRHVADFLSEDVLARQPGDVVDFLLATSILGELTPDLCDTVTTRDDSRSVLRELARSNLFVVPLDEDGEAYRYHHLFGEYLRARLVQRDPGGAAELHRRAWRWYRDHGLPGPAVRHAQAAGDVRTAAEMVAAQYRPLAQLGHTETVRAWVAGFTEEELEAHAPLAIVGTWMAALEGDEDRTRRLGEAARRARWEGPMPDGTASLESALALMPQTSGVTRLHRDAQRAVALEPPDSPWRAIALLRFGSATYLRGDFVAARQALEEACALSAEGTSTHAVVLTVLAWVDIRVHDDDAAWAHARAAFAIADQPGLSSSMPSAGTFGVWAHVSCRRRDWDAARAALARVDDLLPKATSASWWLVAHTHLLVAPVLATLGREEEARDRLDRAASLLVAHPDHGRLGSWLREAEQSIRPRRQLPPAEVLSAAELRVLRLLGTDLSLREIARELCLSLNTVKTHTHAIYRKLGVSSRVEAARHARQVRASGPR